MAEHQPPVEMVKQRLLREVRGLEVRAARYAADGMSALEFVKMVIYSSYVLVRAVEPFEDVTDTVKLRAIQEIIPMVVNRYTMDIPGLPAFMDAMIRDFALTLVVKAASSVLLGTHFTPYNEPEPAS